VWGVGWVFRFVFKSMREKDLTSWALSTNGISSGNFDGLAITFRINQRYNYNQVTEVREGSTQRGGW
jgi:hypothetical protein